MGCCNIRRSMHWLIKWFKTFLSCIRHMADASDCIYHPIMGLTMPLFVRWDYQNGPKLWYFGYLPSKENWLLCCKERHQLLLECFRTFLRPLDELGIWEVHMITLVCHPWVSLCHVQPQWTLKLLTKCQFLRTFPVQQMGWYYLRRDSQCLWSVSNLP